MPLLFIRGPKQDILLGSLVTQPRGLSDVRYRLHQRAVLVNLARIPQHHDSPGSRGVISPRNAISSCRSRSTHGVSRRKVTRTTDQQGGLSPRCSGSFDNSQRTLGEHGIDIYPFVIFQTCGPCRQVLKVKTTSLAAVSDNGEDSCEPFVLFPWSSLTSSSIAFHLNDALMMSKSVSSPVSDSILFVAVSLKMDTCSETSSSSRYAATRFNETPVKT